METGVVTSETLPQILRNISQRRRQGVFSVNYGERKLNISFVQGKVLEVQWSDISPVMELDQRLQGAEVLKRGIASKEMGYAEYFRVLKTSDCVERSIDEAFYKRAIRHLVLDKLYNMDLAGGAYYTFEVQMVECEKDYLPSVSVGQLLLDLVAISTDAPRFRSIFAADAKIEAGEALNGATLSEEEEMLVQALDGVYTVDQMRKRSLLSTYHFQDTLMAMQERGAIKVNSAAKPSKPRLSDEMFADLDQSIDSAFAPSGQAMSEVEETSVLEQTLELRGGPLVDEGVNLSGGRVNSIGLKFRMWNLSLLQNTWIPALAGFIILVLGLALPWVSWAALFRAFGVR